MLAGTMCDQPTPRPRGSTLLCWLLILACVGWVAGRVFMDGRSRHGKTDDFQFELNGRLLIGQKLLTKEIGQAAPPAADALRTLDASASSPQQKLRVAIAAGELVGAEEALLRLKSPGPATTTQPLSDDVRVLEKIYSGHRDELTADQRLALVEHHGWFGKLALVYALPEEHAERAGVVWPAQRAIWVAGGAVIGILLLILVGVVLLIVAIVLLSNGTIRRLYAPVIITNGPPVFLEAFTIYITTLVLFGTLIHRLLPGTPWIAYLLLTLLIPLVLIWPTWRGVSRRDSLIGFGWHRGRGLFTEMGCGIAGYIAGLPLVALGFFITIGLSKYAGVSPSHPIVNEVRGGWFTIAMIYVLASLWAPLMEETMFRGALFNHLRARWSWIVSALIVGLLFALVHPQGWTTIPALGAIGGVLAIVREWRGSLIGPMTAHALNNATVITIVIALMG